MALTDNLISYWKVDEANGDASDSVVASSNTLTNNNTVAYAAGILNNCAVFTGGANNRYFEHAHINAFDVGTGNFTISCWTKCSADNEGCIIGNAGAQVGDHGMGFRFRSDGKLWVQTNTSNLPVFEASKANANYSTGNWIHWAVVRTSQVVKVWRNGVSLGTNNDANDYQHGVESQVFRIGRLNRDQTAYFTGSIDEIGIWTRAITDDEVATLYGSGTPPAYPFSTTPTTLQINIGDNWKQLGGYPQINIADSWKTVTSASINIGDNWKVIF
jgi:hypothetical protein